MAVRAQYAARGRRRRAASPATARSTGVAPDSRTETYAALRLHVSNWRWAGVPFYLRTGKRLARKVDRDRRHAQARPASGVPEHRLGRRAGQPDHPHGSARRGRVGVARGEDPRPEDADPPRQHGVPLRDVVHVRVARGLRATDPRRDARRRTLFTRNDEIEALWGIIDPILTAWHAGHLLADPAVRGRTAGPEEANAAARGRHNAGGGCERRDRGRLGRARHDARRHRGGAARACCASAMPPTARWRRHGCST